jgi:hypothetical protein
MLIIQQALFLVGGFGENNYMKIRLKQRFELRPNGQNTAQKLTVLSPNIGFVSLFSLMISDMLSKHHSGWESIANGAVQCELLGIQNLIPVRIARYNLGIECSSHYDPTRHRLADKYMCEWRQVPMAKNQVEWCLHRVLMTPSVSNTPIVVSSHQVCLILLTTLG